MPKFNDNQPDPNFHSTRKLLMTIAPVISTDPADPTYQAMAVLWARLIEHRTTFKRSKVPAAYKPRSRSSGARDAVGSSSEAEELPWIDIEANARAFDAFVAKLKEPK